MTLWLIIGKIYIIGCGTQGLSRKTGSTAQICFLPKPITVQDENDKTIRLGLYSEDYDCCFDKINVEGLDPWTYDEVMGKEMQRLKNPVKENE